MKERINYNDYLAENILLHCSHTSWGIIFNLLHIHGKGYCKIYSFDDDPEVWYVSELHVDEKYRNQGIGTQLMNICFDISQKYNASNMQLQIYDDAEEFVHSWYRRLGFALFVRNKKEKYSWLIKNI